MFIYDDNFLTDQEKDGIDSIFFSKLTSWHLHKKTQEGYTSHAAVIDTNVVDVPYFTTIPKPEDYKHFSTIIEKFCNKHNILYKEISRIKLNIQPSVKDQYTLYPHVDIAEPHYVFLYYVNDSDGDTVIYNEKFTGEKILNNPTIMHSITPKRGSAFLVDGSHFHSITPPKDTMLRGVINANHNSF